MSSFRDDLKYSQPSNENIEKTYKIDAYRTFVSETIPGYIGFLEAINHSITELETAGVVRKVHLRSRVKALNSAMFNTDEKVLDDIFGFEIVTQSERDKEILMTIIHNLFAEKYTRHKNHNKSNGYFAHHCVGAVKRKPDGTEVSDIEKHILEAETDELKEEYRDLSQKKQKLFHKNEIFQKKYRYPILRQEILENGHLDSETKSNITWAIQFADQYLSSDIALRKSIPVVEMQFKTMEVENEAKYGRAQHAKYKKVDENEIKQAYLNKKLIRGINFPFVLVRNKDGNIEIEHTSETLMSMWPFLDTTIRQYCQTHEMPVANYDMYFAKVFPALEPYVHKNLVREPCVLPDGYDSTMVWSILKNKILSGNFILPDSDKVMGKLGRN